MTMRRVLFATAIAAIALVGLSANSCGEKKEEDATRRCSRDSA